MKINANTAFADAWAMWNADRDLLLRIIGPLIFLPQFAALLLLPRSPKLDAVNTTDEAAIRAWFETYMNWFQVTGPWLALVEVIALYGALVVTMSYLGGDRPTLGTALLSSLRLLPRYFFAAILVSLPAGGIVIPVIGYALLLPVLYLFGRWLLTGPEIVAEQPVGAVDAIRHSFTMTRGNGLVMMGIAGLLIFGGQIAALPFVALGDVLGGAPEANPVVKVLLDALTSASLTAVALAGILLRISLYYQLRSVSRGI